MLPTSVSFALPLSSLRKLFEARGRLLCPMSLDQVEENGKFHIASQSLSSFSANNEIGLRDLGIMTGQRQAAGVGRSSNLPDLDHVSCPRVLRFVAEIPFTVL